MSVAIGIVAHSARRAQADELRETVNAEFISYDDEDACRHMGAEENHRTVWRLLAGTDATWCMVIEDDALPVDGFLDQLGMALDASPGVVTSCYLGRQRPPQWQRNCAKAIHQANDADAHYIVGSHLLHGVGVAVRTEHVPDMLNYLTEHNYLPVDECIGTWVRDNGLTPIVYTHPSLLEHRDAPTLIKHRDGHERPPGRVAWQTGTRTAWSGDRTVTL